MRQVGVEGCSSTALQTQALLLGWTLPAVRAFALQQTLG